MAEITPIREVNNSRNDWTIEANVYRVWYDAISHDLCFILTDAEKTRIAGIVPRELLDRYYEMIDREDFWLRLTDFEVVDAPLFGRNSLHAFQIRLANNTRLRWQSFIFPCKIYDFISLEEILNNTANHTTPLDLVGAVTSVGPLIEWSYERGLPRPWYTRFSVDFTIEDEQHNSIDATAYASHAEVLTHEWENKNDPFLICFFKSVRIINVEGFKSVDVEPKRSVILYKSRDDPEAEDFAERFIFRDEGLPSSSEGGMNSESDDA